MLLGLPRRIHASSMALMEYCHMRARLVITGRISSNRITFAREEGIRLHKLLSSPLRSFDRMLVISKLGWPDRVYSREIPGEGVELTGRCPDDLRVLNVYERGKLVRKVISLVEYKTTSKSIITSADKEMAKFQLQEYLWLLEGVELPFPLHKYHYVEFYKQDPKDFLRPCKLVLRIRVEKDKDIEKKLKTYCQILKQERGTRYPTEKNRKNQIWKCVYCPPEVKKECWYYKTFWREIHGYH